MTNYLIAGVFGLALLSSLVLTRLARALAVRLKAIDRPDGWRKLHVRPVPLWGGVAVFFSLVLSLVIARHLPGLASPLLSRFSTTILLSAGLIFVLGFIDDSFDLRGRLKLALQITAVIPAVAAGYWLDNVIVWGCEVHLGYLGIPLAILWLVGCINAVNLLDGMDGNASTIGILAAATMGTLAAFHGQSHAMAVAAALCGALVGFFCYNRPPASIYLGDSGSTVIGFVLGILCLEASPKSTGALAVFAPLATMTIPLLDTSLAIVRRKLTGRRFDAADRGHIHHRLLDRGFHTWQALGIICGVSTLAGVGVVAAEVTGHEAYGWGSSAILILALAKSGWFGRHEALLVKLSSAALLSSLANSLLASTSASPRAKAARLPNISFDSAWQSLVHESSFWPTRRIELRLREADSLRASHVWASHTAEGRDVYRWRLAMSFGAASGTRCELLVEGEDSISSEPWYLNRVAAMLRVYGRYWAAQPERVPPLHLKPFPAFEPAAATTPYRDAA